MMTANLQVIYCFLLDMIGKRFFWTCRPQLIAFGGLALSMLFDPTQVTAREQSSQEITTKHPSASEPKAVRQPPSEQAAELTADELIELASLAETFGVNQQYDNGLTLKIWRVRDTQNEGFHHFFTALPQSASYLLGSVMPKFTYAYIVNDNCDLTAAYRQPTGGDNSEIPLDEVHKLIPNEYSFWRFVLKKTQTDISP
jgi:hypothetical protein